jgi:YggT family protein
MIGPTPRPGTPMVPLLQFIDYIINLYEYVIIAGVVLSWLMAFSVVNPYNRYVMAINQTLGALTEPFLRRIRRVMPDLGAVDISPIVLLLICFFLRSVVIWGWLIPFFARR